MNGPLVKPLRGSDVGRGMFNPEHGLECSVELTTEVLSLFQMIDLAVAGLFWRWLCHSHPRSWELPVW